MRCRLSPGRSRRLPSPTAVPGDEGDAAEAAEAARKGASSMRRIRAGRYVLEKEGEGVEMCEKREAGTSWRKRAVRVRRREELGRGGGGMKCHCTVFALVYLRWFILFTSSLTGTARVSSQQYERAPPWPHPRPPPVPGLRLEYRQLHPHCKGGKAGLSDQDVARGAGAGFDRGKDSHIPDASDRGEGTAGAGGVCLVKLLKR